MRSMHGDLGRVDDDCVRSGALDVGVAVELSTAHCADRGSHLSRQAPRCARRKRGCPASSSVRPTALITFAARPSCVARTL